jgi:hypothetical protein
MSALGKNCTIITEYVRSLRGGSQPILVRASDGFRYVAKFTNNLQGPNLAFNESAGGELYRAAGLAVPVWQQLMVTDDFIERNPDCWIQTREGRLRPDSGLCFGSRFLGGTGIRLLEILPGTSFKRVRNYQSFWLAWMIDICAEHIDNRQAVFLEDLEGAFDGYFVDNGHLFGGPKGGQRKHFLASRYLDPRIYQKVSLQQLRNFRESAASIDTDRLWRRIQALPDQWKTTSATEGFTECLNRLSNRTLLKGILDTMAEAQDQTHGIQQKDLRAVRELPKPVLYPGVQAAGRKSRFVATGNDHFARA